MTAVAIELLTRPPDPATLLAPDAQPVLQPDAVEFIADTDTLLTLCSCSGSSDQPYAG